MKRFSQRRKGAENAKEGKGMKNKIRAKDRDRMIRNIF